jgi:hypothetical protein
MRWSDPAALRELMDVYEMEADFSQMLESRVDALIESFVVKQAA